MVDPSAEPSAEPSPEPEPESYPESPDLQPEEEPNGSAQSESEPAAIPEDRILSEHETITWTFLYLLLIVAILIINALIIRAMFKRRGGTNTESPKERLNCIRKPSDLFLLSLIVARMNVAAFVMPARIMGMFSTEGIGSLVCKACAFAGTGSATTSVFCTCAVAVCKVVELKYSGRPSRRNTLYVIGLLWIIGHLYAVREPFLNDIVEREHSGGDISFICAENPKYQTATAIFMFFDILLLFVIPSVIVICSTASFISLLSKPAPVSTPVTNDKLFDIIVKTHPDIKQGEMLPRNNNALKDTKQCNITSNQPRSPGAHTLKTKDTRYMALIIMMLFIFCYAASYTWKALLLTNSLSHLKIETALSIEQSVYLWCFLNPILNAMTYLYFRVDIRVRFKSIFLNIGRKSDKRNLVESIKANELAVTDAA